MFCLVHFLKVTDCSKKQVGLIIGAAQCPRAGFFFLLHFLKLLYMFLGLFTQNCCRKWEYKSLLREPLKKSIKDLSLCCHCCQWVDVLNLRSNKAPVLHQRISVLQGIFLKLLNYIWKQDAYMSLMESVGHSFLVCDFGHRCSKELNCMSK